MLLKQRVVLASVVLFGLILSDASDAVYPEFEPGFNIANVIEATDLVVTGVVTAKAFVYRPTTPFKETTDISVTVDQTIKGTPNNGSNSVIFMHPGGTGVHPNGTVYRTEFSDTPEFDIGDRVMLFLYKQTTPGMNIPHDGYLLFYGYYGKRPIKNNKLLVWYTKEVAGKKRPFAAKLPVDLVVDIAKAAKEDHEAAEQLETDIKSRLIPDSVDINLSTTLVDRLKREAKKIVKQAKAKQTQ